MHNPLHTPICDRLGIEYPVFLAGMGGVSLSRLVAAVSNAGGLGIMGAATLGPDQLRDEIQVQTFLRPNDRVCVVLPRTVVRYIGQGDGAEN